MSRAVRVPGRIESEATAWVLSVPGTPQGIVTPPDFVGVEKVTAFELGHRWSREDFSFDLVGFYNKYKNLRAYRSSLEDLFVGDFFGIQTILAQGQSRWVIDSEMYGSEAALTWQPLDTLRLRGSYSLLGYHFDSNANDSIFDGVAFEPGAKHIANLGAIWNLVYNLDFDTYLRFVDTVRSYSGAERGEIAAARLRLDSRFEWHCTPKWSIELIGQNLLGTTQEYTDDDDFSLPARIGPSGTLRLKVRL